MMVLTGLPTDVDRSWTWEESVGSIPSEFESALKDSMHDMPSDQEDARGPYGHQACH